MGKIKQNILVMSGKGGVGKTTVAINLAYFLSKKRHKVGLLDIDVHGPNVPKMLGVENGKIATEGNMMLPLETPEGIKIISMAFLIGNSDAVIWRGPMKHNLVRQFLQDVKWGELDYLVIDFPPGTGDEAISMCQLLEGPKGTVIVSTPQDVSLLDAERAVSFSEKMGIPILGLVENMAGDVFGKGKVLPFAERKGVAFLGSLPLSREITLSGNAGKPFLQKDSETGTIFESIASRIIDSCSKEGEADEKDF